MRTSDSPVPDRRANVPAARPDVLTVRSRMRTKYGSQSQIQQVAQMLGANETLLHLAVADGTTSPDHHDHGLLALTDQRLVFVPRAAGGTTEEIPLDAVRTLVWIPGAGTGSLTVRTVTGSAPFGRVANADGRDLCTRIVVLRPSVGRASPG